VKFVFYSVDVSGKLLLSVDVIPPLWVLRKTEEVPAAAAFLPVWSRRVSFYDKYRNKLSL